MKMFLRERLMNCFRRIRMLSALQAAGNARVRWGRAAALASISTLHSSSSLWSCPATTGSFGGYFPLSPCGRVLSLLSNLVEGPIIMFISEM